MKLSQLLPSWWPVVLAWKSWVMSYAWWGIGGAALLMTGFMLLSGKSKRSTVHGSEQWSSRGDLRRNDCFNIEGFLLGRAYGQDVRSPHEQNVVLFAPPGEGKSSGPIAASLIARWSVKRHEPPSAVVMDLSGELVSMTAQYRQRFGPVYIWDPTSMRSDLLNPYDLVDWDTIDEPEQLQRLMSHVVSSQGLRTSSGASHYERVADHTLVITSQYVAHEQKIPYCTFEMMLDFFSSEHKPVALLQEMTKHWHRSVNRGARRMLSQSTPRKIQEDWSAAAEWLTRWEDPKLARNTSATTIPWRDLQYGQTPMTLYICLSSDDARGRLNRLARMTYDLMVYQLSHHGPRAHRRELDWYFDDVGVLGDFPPLDDIAVEHRKDGFRVIAGFQSPEQAWHESGRYAGLLNSCGCWVIYRQNSPDSAKFLEAKLGETTVVETSERVTTGRYRSRSRGMQPYKRPLLTYGELQSMRPGKVVMCVRDQKVRGDRINVYDDDRFEGCIVKEHR